jgi:hypothetical protein
VNGIFDEKEIQKVFYAAISVGLKDRIRPAFPEIDQWPEEEAIELCLAYNRALKVLLRQGA